MKVKHTIKLVDRMISLIYKQPTFNAKNPKIQVYIDGKLYMTNDLSTVYKHTIYPAVKEACALFAGNNYSDIDKNISGYDIVIRKVED